MSQHLEVDSHLIESNPTGGRVHRDPSKFKFRGKFEARTTKLYANEQGIAKQASKSRRAFVPDLQVGNIHLKRCYVPKSVYWDRESVEYIKTYFDPRVNYDDLTSDCSKQNKHPLSAAARVLAEGRVIYDIVNAHLKKGNTSFPIIHDVGGCVKRHLEFNRESFVWCSNPDFILGDQLSFKEVEEERRKSVSCTHLAQDCKCRDFDYSMSVHSLYYLKPEDLIRVVLNTKNKLHYAVIHRYKDDKGVLMRGEMTYTKSAANEVTVEVRGNSHPYVHGDMGWLNEHEFLWGRYRLSWKLLYSIAETDVFEMYVTRTPGKARKPLNIVIHEDSKKMTEEIMEFLDSKSEYLLTKSMSESDRIMWINWVTRDPRYKDLAKNKVSRKVISEAMNTVFYDMSKHTGGNLVKYRDSITVRKFNTLNKLRVDPTEVLSESWWYVYVRTFASLFLTLTLLNPILSVITYSSHIAKILMFMGKNGEISMAIVLFFTLFGLFNKSAKLRNSFNFNFYIGVVKCVSSCFESEDRGYCKERLRKYKPPIFDLCKSRVVGESFFTAYNSPVHWPHSCYNNVNQCFNNRIAVPLTSQPVVTYGRGTTAMEVPTSLIEAAGQFSWEPISFEEWVSRFPKSKADRYIKEMKEALSKPTERNKKMFIKGEFMPKRSKAPRPVVASGVEEAFLSGQYCVPFARFLCKLLNCNNNIFLTYSATSEEIGRWVHTRRREGYKFYKNDFSQFDSTQHDGIHNWVREFLRIVGAPSDAIKYIDDEHKGRVNGPCGLIYEIKSVRNSGGASTWLLNSIINVAVTYSALINQGVSERNISIMASGDDGIIAVKDSNVSSSKLDMFVASLGMKSEFLSCEKLTDLEFCSSYFVPYSGGLKLVKKSGRLLAKTFWIKNGVKRWSLKYFQQIAGMVKGLENDLNMMPILRILPVIARNIKLYDSVCAKREEFNNYARQKDDINEDAWAFYEELYGLPRRAFEDVERRLIMCTRFPIVLEEEVVNIMIERDWTSFGEFNDVTTELFRNNIGHYELISPFLEELFKALCYYNLSKELFFLTCSIFGAFESALYNEGFILCIVRICAHFLFVFFGNYYSDKFFEIHPFIASLLMSFAIHLTVNLYLLNMASAGSYYRYNFAGIMTKNKNKTGKKKKSTPATVPKNSVKEIAKAVARASLDSGLTTAGSAIFGPPGALVGKKASSFIRHITGIGDYKINKNSLVMGNGPPSFGSSKRGTIVTHREFLGNISSSTNFSQMTFPINPGSVATFPWLSGIAVNYEEWKPLGIVFEFHSLSASALNSTNTALGAVIMATQYNVGAPAFVSKMQMENHEFCVSTKPSESVIHPVECDPSMNVLGRFYVKGDEEEVKDRRFFDLGDFSLATQGMQAVAEIGELWVSYEIELMKPKYSIGARILSARYTTASWTNNDVFGQVISSFKGNFSPYITNKGGYWDSIAFPPEVNHGRFIITVSWVGNNTACSLGLWTYTNCTGLTIFNNGVSAMVSSSGTVPVMMLVSAVEVTSSGAYVRLAASTLPTGGSNMTITVSQLASVPLMLSESNEDDLSTYDHVVDVPNGTRRYLSRN